MDSVLLKEFNWTSMLDDVGPTCWLTWDQRGGWCYSNMFQMILDQHVWSTGRALKTHYSTIGISMTSNQQHSKQNSNTVTVILINNLQTSTEQLVLNHLTHKWKSCASPKVTKTWHNLFKKRYCLSSNSAVTDLLKNYIKKKLFNDVLESWFCGNVGKLCRNLETFFCLTWDFLLPS